MIEVVSIEVIGATERTAFRGMLKLEPGLNVLSAENAYGKSLAMNAVPWCLGLEPMFGLQNNDPSRFPLAVRDAIKLQGAGEQEVQSSSARVTFKRDDGARLILERAIKGSSTETVQVTEVGIAGESRSSQLYARRETMADETGGLQRFLFEWMHLPRVNLMNLKGKPSQLYLENVAPLFFIDQNEAGRTCRRCRCIATRSKRWRKLQWSTCWGLRGRSLPASQGNSECQLMRA